MKTKWFVWNPNKFMPRFVHETAQSAKQEAERLARLNPGERFMVLQSISECVKNDVLWESHDNPPVNDCEIPF